MDPGLDVGLLRFCEECNNMMTPVEDAVNKRLKYICRRCDSYVFADTNLVYKDDIRYNEDYRYNTTDWKEFAQDPTLPHFKAECPRCAHDEAVVQSDSGSKFASMKLYFICTSPDCGHRWMPLDILAAEDEDTMGGPIGTDELGEPGGVGAGVYLDEDEGEGEVAMMFESGGSGGSVAPADGDATMRDDDDDGLFGDGE